jgi:hypothetical protein
VDLACAPAARPADCLLRFPLFEPLADRCALMCVESIASSSGMPPVAASRSNKRRQMP